MNAQSRQRVLGFGHTMWSQADYDEAFVQPKLITSLELSPYGNQLNANGHEHHHQEDGIKGNIPDHFPLLTSGDHRLTGQRTPLQINDFGFGQPQYPFADPCNGIYSTYGTHFASRILLPRNLTTSDVDVPIYVNAKQYNGIVRRRKKRAEQEAAAAEKKVLKFRKSYMNLSRHLHAMRRPRGSGGRFLNSKPSNASDKLENPKKSEEEREDKHKQNLPFYHPTGSQISEVVDQSDKGGNDINRCGGIIRSNSLGSELSSHGNTIITFDINQHHHHHHYSSFEASFSSNKGLGIDVMASGGYA